MSSWNNLYPIFNDSCVTESVAVRQFVRRRVVARASEARRQISKHRYWIDDLSGLTLNGRQLEEIRAIEALARGDVFPILKRISSFCFLENEDGSPAPLGVGNGTPRTFQLKKTTHLQGRTIVDEVAFPWFDYPPMLDLNGEDWEPLEELRIWVGDYRTGGINITADCDIDRNTGLIGSDGNGILYSTGGFLTKMLAPNGIPVTPQGKGIYEVSGTVQLIEPFPGVDELLGL